MYGVKREARNLDKHVPGWHDRIDLGKLSMFNEDYCVIGQLYGRWGFDYPSRDGIKEKKIAYGTLPFRAPENPVLFYPLIVLMIPMMSPQLFLLKKIWVKEIKQRRAADQQRKQTVIPDTFPAEWEETHIALVTSAR